MGENRADSWGPYSSSWVVENLKLAVVIVSHTLKCEDILKNSELYTLNGWIVWESYLNKAFFVCLFFKFGFLVLWIDLGREIHGNWEATHEAISWDKRKTLPRIVTMEIEKSGLVPGLFLINN